ncbi:uncharacterized protein [Parasteatoda tepidariorum]|uniref:uncharacterized protein n=1 Tax=Parasteatoda tepidariorum TaxID=114398 RepID=UPI0039BCC505
MTAYRMKLQYQWHDKPSSGGHTSITKKIHHPTLLMPSDCMERKYVFERPFEVVLPTREEWDNNTIDTKNDDLIWYTDGSMKGSLSGLGVCGLSPGFNFFEGLGEYATVFQAERQSSSLDGSLLISSQIKNCSGMQESPKRNKIILISVPRHMGINGNERADELAKQGSFFNLIGTEPFCGINMKATKKAVLKWEKQEMNKVWHNSPGQKHAKSMISSPSSKIASVILRLPRLKIQSIVGFITGHYHFRKYLHRLGLFEQEPICRKCGEAVESAHHILYECDALTLTRLTILGNPYPKELHLNSIKGMSDYINKVGDPRQWN